MPNGQALKKKFQELIENYSDLDFLEILYNIALEHSNREEPYLTPAQLARLEESSKQVKEGKTIPHEEVMKMMNQWLKE